jgi:iron complex outermembrane receptor protein
MTSTIRHAGARALLASTSLAAMACALSPEASHAQQTAAAAPPTQLEEIVVTAQRREENLQKVPISITSVSGKTLADTGYESVTDLQYVVPGVQYDPTQGSAFQIRGVGSESFDFSNEKSVSVVVDDVVMDAQRENGLQGLEDIKRVDVLMGPQGTLFGKNATSGVISVTTNDPVLNQWSGKASASYGQRNDRNINATLNVPLGSMFALRVSGFYQGQDGPGEYVTLHKNLGGFEEYGYRAKLLFEPSDKLQVELSSDYAHHYDTTIRTAVSGAPTAVTNEEIALGVTPGPENASDADSSLGSITTTNWGETLHVKYKVGQDTLTSITAYRATTYDNDTPADLVPTSVYAYIPFNDGALTTSKVSQEIRLASPTGQFVEYVAGLFYNRLIADQTQLQWATLGAPLVSASGVPDTRLYALTGAIGRSGDESLFLARNQTAAGFGQIKFNLTKRFNIAFGGRYTYDHNAQSLTYPYVNPVPITGEADTFIPTSAPPLYPTGEITGRNFSYRISPQYQVTDNLMLYFTYSTGYKPAGVAFVGNEYDPYKAETVKSYEVGEKAEFFDHRLRFDFDLYDENFTNFQATILTSIPGSVTLQSVIGNAGGLKSEGAEASFAWKPINSFTLSGSATYSDAYFTNYVYNTTTNYTDTRLTNAPRWAVFAAADYSHPIGSALTALAHLDYSYRSTIWTVVGQPSYSEVPGYSLFNARLTFTPTRAPVQFGIYARNLFNTYFSTGWQEYGALGLLHYTSLDAYRTVGGFVKYSF